MNNFNNNFNFLIIIPFEKIFHIEKQIDRSKHKIIILPKLPQKLEFMLLIQIINIKLFEKAKIVIEWK